MALAFWRLSFGKVSFHRHIISHPMQVKQDISGARPDSA